MNRRRALLATLGAVGALPGVELIKNELSEDLIDLFVLVDAGSLDRIGSLAVEFLEKGIIRKWVILDHHLSY